MLASGEPAALLLGDDAVRDEATLALADAIAATTGAKVLAEVFPTRIRRRRGHRAGRAPRLPRRVRVRAARPGSATWSSSARASPVSFFAYPGKASDLVPDGCEVHVLTDVAEDGVERRSPTLADRLGAAAPTLASRRRRGPARPTGALTAQAVAEAVGATLAEDAIVVDEAQTGGIWASPATAGCPPHDWLTLTGGSIGFGMPVATGAAVACPDRPVLNLQADGSAMYTLQSLWTQAREGLDVTTVILANRSYAILNLELVAGRRRGARTGGAVDARPHPTRARLRVPRARHGRARPSGPRTARRSSPRWSAPTPSPAPTSSRRSSLPASDRSAQGAGRPSAAGDLARLDAEQLLQVAVQVHDPALLARQREVGEPGLVQTALDAAAARRRPG